MNRSVDPFQYILVNAALELQLSNESNTLKVLAISVTLVIKLDSPPVKPFKLYCFACVLREHARLKINFFRFPFS